MPRPLDLLLGGAFLSAITLPLGRMLASRFVPELEAVVDRTAELREVTPRPSLEWSYPSLYSYPRRFEDWFADSFAFRDDLIGQLNAFKWFVLDTSPTDLMIKGKHGWVFTTADRSLEVVRGAARFSERELETWKTALEARRDWLARLGIRYHLIIGPNKHSIYPENLPPRVRVRPPTRLDQLRDYLAQHSDLVVPDLRPALLEAKPQDTPDNPLYYPLGTHWTERGSFAAYGAVCEHLRTDFPHIEPLTWEDVRIDTMPGDGDSWAGRMYLRGHLSQKAYRVAPKAPPPFTSQPSRLRDKTRVVTFTHEDASLPRLVMYHDSFATELRRYLAHHFGQIVTYWSYIFDQEMLERERPDAVLQLVAERSLVFVPPTFILSERQDDLARAFTESRDVLWRGPLVQEGRPMLEPSGQGELRVEEKGLLAIDRGGLSIRMPAFEVSQDRWPLLRVDFGPHPRGEVNLLRESPRQQQPRTYLGTFRLERERRRLYLHLLALEPGDRILLAPSGELSELLITRVEVRGVPRGAALSQ